MTVAGARHDLPHPFHVLATQNPIEQEGTYPLPEAQLDRFLLQIDIRHPDRTTERRILIETTGPQDAQATPVMSAEELVAAQRLVRRLPVGESIIEAILDLVRAARPRDGAEGVADMLLWGPGPRAGQALMLAARARALIDGRLAPSLDDVRALAKPVLQHRIALTYEARAQDQTPLTVIERLVARDLTPLMPREPASRRSPGAARARGQVVEAKRLAARLTRIGLEARRIAASMVQGAHGRRRPGVGESFWQFRPFMPGEAALLVDWRRSAREERLFVREREWEGARPSGFGPIVRAPWSSSRIWHRSARPIGRSF